MNWRKRLGGGEGMKVEYVNNDGLMSFYMEIKNDHVGSICFDHIELTKFDHESQIYMTNGGQSAGMLWISNAQLWFLITTGQCRV